MLAIKGVIDVFGASKRRAEQVRQHLPALTTNTPCEEGASMAEANPTALHHGFHADPDTGVCYRALDFMGYPGYRVGDDGSVWTSKVQAGRRYFVSQSWRAVKAYSSRSARPKVTLSHFGCVITIYVHTLVLRAFVGKRPEGHECAHGNGLRSDNRLANLRWATPAENARDRDTHGTTARGTKITCSKLTEATLRAAKLDYDTGEYSYCSLARKYGVSEAAMRKAIKGQQWKHVQ